MFDPLTLLNSRALLLAPMEDVTDLPFRVIRKRNFDFRSVRPIGPSRTSSRNNHEAHEYDE